MATRTKQKAASLLQNKDTRPTAHARHIRISPYKVRTVLGVVRGKPVNQALALLQNMPRGASEAVFKVVSSAVANAENNQSLLRDDLFIAEITASQGATLKRMLPKAKGSSSRMLKRTSHITVKLDEIKEDGIIDVAKDKKVSKANKKVDKKQSKSSDKSSVKDKSVSKSAKTPKSTTKASTNNDKKAVKKPETSKATVNNDKKPNAKSVAKETDNGSKG